MESSSMCEKTRIDLVVKTQEISFENSIDKLSFWYESFSSKISRDKHLER